MILLCLLASLVVSLLYRWCSNRRSLPPGPPSLPLLGSLPFLQLSKGLTDWVIDTRVTRHRLATVGLGPSNVFVINDLQLGRELLEKAEFSGRPEDQWGRLFKAVGGVMRGIINTEGENWVKQRRFGLRTLRDLGFGRRTVEEIINEELEELCLALTREDGQDYLLGSDFNIPLINVLWQLVAGYRFDQHESQGRDVINNINEMFRNYITFFTIPIGLIKVFRRQFFEENLKIATNQTQYILEQIEKHRATLDRDNPRDFIDVYLIAMEDDEGLNTDDLAMNLFDFLIAGTETSSTTLKWVVLYLTLHQEVQDRCREEIRRVVGDNKCTIEDIMRLPYTQATVSETHRLAAVLPLAVGHKTLTSVQVEDYSFPAGSWFNFNLQFIMRDSTHFQNPQQFNPERFIGEDGRYKRHPALVPFGVGKRQCMGEALARNEVMLFTVGLIQRLSFLPPGSGDRPDPERYHVSVTRIPTDFTVRIKAN